MLVLVGCGIFALRLVNSAVSLWLRLAHLRITKEAVLQLREDLLLRLYVFSRSLYTTLDRNTMHAQIIQDSERLDVLSNQVVSKIMPAVFTGLVLLLVLAYLNWFLLLVMVLLAPVPLVANRATGRVVKRRVFAFQRAFDRFSKGMMLVRQNMDLTRIQAFEKGEIERQTQDLKELKDTGQRMALIFALHGQIQSTVVGVCGIVILVIGGAAVSTGSMTIGEFLSFWVAAGLLNSHVSTVTSSIPQVISGNESMVTLHRLAHPGAERPYRGTRRVEFDGTIDLRDVVHGYDGGRVLDGVNLTIRSTSNIALVGANGSGKSTILYLTLGFYRPESGILLANGVPYDLLDLVELRRSIGVVMQNPTFFSGTILDNISYGHVNVRREEIVQAARISLADEFVRGLPNGYDTQVGESGVLLSGGEAQRLAIARALLRRPKLLVLDEPTNHLDASVIARLVRNLDELGDRPAIVTISHNQDVTTQADEIYRLDGGRLEPRTPVLAGQGGGR